MPSLTNIGTWNLTAAILAAIGALVYLLYRGGQLTQISLKNKALRAHSKRDRLELEAVLCPDFDEREIRSAQQSYVRPDCAQIDPANEQQMQGFASVREQVYSALDRFVGDKAKHHIMVLADSGMGKTTLCLNYYARFNDPQLYVALISLSRSQAEERIARVPSKRSTVLILDAFDEDAAAMFEGPERLAQLLGLCSEFRTVIITCRSQFFENDAAIPSHTGIARIIPHSGQAGAYHDLSRLYLLPFDERQVVSYLRRRFPFFSLLGLIYRRRASALINRIPDLTVRPMLLALVPDLVRENENPKGVFDLYTYMVDKWLERESRWVSKEKLYRVSEDLAMLLFERQYALKTGRISPDELRSNTAIDLSDINWNHLTTRSLLNRDSEGRLKFAHRSIMEFLVVRAAISGKPRSFSLQWTDFMRELLINFTQVSEDNLRAAREVLLGLFQNREDVRLPIAELIPGPGERTPERLRGMLGQGQSVLVFRKELPVELRDLTIERRRQHGHLFLYDYENDLQWRVPDYSDRNFVNDNQYRSTLADVTVGQYAGDYDLPSFPEFLSLLRLQDAFPEIRHIRQFDYYWLGDWMANARYMVVSLKQTLKAEGVIPILTDAEVVGGSSRINLYAISDQKRDTLKNLRAVELRVLRGALRRRFA